MRLWSLPPKYLDARGLVALWREALLAQAVLTGKRRGYGHHPQLRRFQNSPAPEIYIAEYLKVVHREAARRGYNFDARKIGRGGKVRRLVITEGQLKYELAHLRRKLKVRAPRLEKVLRGLDAPQPHPLFRVIKGGIAEWEVGSRARRAKSR